MKTKILVLLSVLLLITGCSNSDEQAKTNAHHVPVVIQSSDGNETITYNAEEFSNAEWLYENFFGDYNFPDSFKYPMMIEMQKLANGFALKFAKAKTTDEMVSEYSKFYNLKQSSQFQKFYAQTVTHFSAMSADELADNEEAFKNELEKKSEEIKKDSSELFSMINIISQEEVEQNNETSLDNDIFDHEPTDEEIKVYQVANNNGYKIDKERISPDVTDENERKRLQALIDQDDAYLKKQIDMIDEYNLPYIVEGHDEKIASIAKFSAQVKMLWGDQDLEPHPNKNYEWTYDTNKFKTGDILLVEGAFGLGHTAMISIEDNDIAFVYEVTPILNNYEVGTARNAMQKTKLSDWLTMYSFYYHYRPTKHIQEKTFIGFGYTTYNITVRFLWFTKVIKVTGTLPLYEYKDKEAITDSIKQNAISYMTYLDNNDVKYNLFAPKWSTTHNICSKSIWQGYNNQGFDLERPVELWEYFRKFETNGNGFLQLIQTYGLVLGLVDAYFVTPQEITLRGQNIQLVDQQYANGVSSGVEVFWDFN